MLMECTITINMVTECGSRYGKAKCGWILAFYDTDVKDQLYQKLKMLGNGPNNVYQAIQQWNASRAPQGQLREAYPRKEPQPKDTKESLVNHLIQLFPNQWLEIFIIRTIFQSSGNDKI